MAAAHRTTRARRARCRRFAAAALTGALAFAALTPAALDPAHRDLAVAAAGDVASMCDLARTGVVACEGPMVLHRPYAIN